MNIATSRYHVSTRLDYTATEQEQQRLYDTIDRLIDAAIAGGMDKNKAVEAVEDIWYAGWETGKASER
jgi:hypothetical protein